MPLFFNVISAHLPSPRYREKKAGESMSLCQLRWGEEARPKKDDSKKRLGLFHNYILSMACSLI
jgi:hypothetical protein